MRTLFPPIAVASLALLLSVPAFADEPAPAVQTTTPQATDPTPAEPAPPQPAPAEAPPQPEGDPFGIKAAEARLGRDVPVGRKIVAGHVEGNNGAYLPNWNAKHFGDVLFVRRSGASEPFGHATATCSEIYGPGGAAPGIHVVHCFSSQHWLTTGYLHSGDAHPPEDDLPRVFSHSWIGGASGPRSGAEHALGRIDWQIDQRDVVMCVGVNNGKDTPVPGLLASAYNAIAVGVASGASSGGYTTADGPGRCKPDLVAPRSLTSFATPVVAGIAARMLEAAGNAPEPSRGAASQSETIKALMMAGATKPDGWKPAPGKPLDEHLGAGSVHLDHSLRILEAGSQPPGTIRPDAGWDHRPLSVNGREHYRFTLDAPRKNVSIMLVWNRRVTPVTAKDPQGHDVWVGIPRLADFDLRLVRITAEGVDTVGISASAIDNVEHVFESELSPGDYAIEVRRQSDGHDEPWDYALAWRAE